MSGSVPIIERAYQLAKSGEFKSLGPIKSELKRLGYVMVDSHIAGASLTSTLRRLCVEAAADHAPDGPPEGSNNLNL